MASRLETLAGFVFGEQALMDGALAGVVDLVGDAGGNRGRCRLASGCY